MPLVCGAVEGGVRRVPSLFCMLSDVLRSSCSVSFRLLDVSSLRSLTTHPERNECELLHIPARCCGRERGGGERDREKSKRKRVRDVDEKREPEKGRKDRKGGGRK